MYLLLLNKIIYLVQWVVLIGGYLATGIRGCLADYISEMDQSKQISISSKPSNQPMKDGYKEKKKKIGQ